MNWAEDLDNRQVRRQAFSKNAQSSEMQDDLLDTSLTTTPEAYIGSAPPPTVGWMETKPALPRSRPAQNIIDNDVIKEKTAHIDSDDDIPEIPDIEDLQNNLASPEKVKQPTILIDRSTYKELDDELSKTPISSNLQTLLKTESINLSLLTKKMLPQKDIKEATDEEWTIESLYTELIAMNSKK